MMNVTGKTCINALKEEQQKYNIERERASTFTNRILRSLSFF
jgi:hypothetical protein